jgi:hypothetical protein
MEFTIEQQTEINRLIEEAKNKVTEGLFTKEQVNEEINKAKENLSEEVKTKYTKQIKLLEDELIKYKPVEKSDTEKALEARESDISKKEKMFKVKESLSQNSLSSDFYEVIYEELDDDARVNKLAEIVNNLVLDGSFKGSKKHSKTNAITKEQFKTMNYDDRAKLYKENPSIYAELSK